MFLIVSSTSVSFIYYVSFFSVFRVNKMVDIVTNRMFDAFNKLDPRDAHTTNESLSTISNLRRFSAEQRFKKTLSREAEQKVVIIKFP